ncbi:hypothetical protein EXE46_04015 [Halorubrum sp. GN11_10-6_MGM]|uniref:DUF7573 domain-containing protein n=1 Tax=Halorubrum sp. GN11_10-6_MGM TaxID=2518112 RepID=UPI0010F89422|nr:hypothetical protein [Halorubrum sp. GN11_10-6_MGM]TKX75327.1 hypothetical protein EXE46_04015 [Halorubrum sp. GN11_10-6_MGM]
MPEDRSLDDFAEAAPAGGETAEAGGDDAESDPAESERDAADANALTDADDVTPAVATSTWHTDGADCDRCGERVQRRWREEDVFVCADCASW